MALIPKNLPPALPSNVTAGRLSGGPRAVASGDGAPVEATNAQDGVLFNDALLFQDNGPQSRDRQGNSQGGQVAEYAGSSQTFASMFESGNATGTGSDVQSTRSRGFANLIARAINTYETNVQVIQGNTDQRGATISVSL